VTVIGDKLTAGVAGEAPEEMVANVISETKLIVEAMNAIRNLAGSSVITVSPIRMKCEK
jgi:hypothetical protein